MAAVDPTPEEWRDVPGFPGYQASDRGRVRSASRVLSAAPDQDRRLFVSLFVGPDRRHHRMLVARLVLLAFVGPPRAGQVVRHKNDDQSDNHLARLCWGTRRENAQDAIRNGKMPRGERHGIAKLTGPKVMEMRAARSRGVALCELARRFGVNRWTVRDVVTRKTWRHL